MKSTITITSHGEHINASAIRLHQNDLISEVTYVIENNFILLCTTVVEDKLQNGLQEYIDKFPLSGINIWVLTGAKLQTAINIWYVYCTLVQICSLTSLSQT